MTPEQTKRTERTGRPFLPLRHLLTDPLDHSRLHPNHGLPVVDGIPGAASYVLVRLQDLPSSGLGLDATYLSAFWKESSTR